MNEYVFWAAVSLNTGVLCVLIFAWRRVLALFARWGTALRKLHDQMNQVSDANRKEAESLRRLSATLHEWNAEIKDASSKVHVMYVAYLNAFHPEDYKTETTAGAKPVTKICVGPYEFWNAPDEDVYTEDDGEPVEAAKNAQGGKTDE